MDQQAAEVIEANVRVRRTAEDAIQGLRELAHGMSPPAVIAAAIDRS